MEKWASPAAGRKTCPAAPDAVTLLLRAGESSPRATVPPQPSVGPRPVSSWKLRPAFWALPSRLCERPR